MEENGIKIMKIKGWSHYRYQKHHYVTWVRQKRNSAVEEILTQVPVLSMTMCTRSGLYIGQFETKGYQSQNGPIALQALALIKRSNTKPDIPCPIFICRKQPLIKFLLSHIVDAFLKLRRKSIIRNEKEPLGRLSKKQKDRIAWHGNARAMDRSVA